MKNKLKFGKITYIRLMMVMAQLLLMGFVGHWLTLQYHEREQLLEKDLNSAWVTSQQQMIDSMLVKEYIQPAMDSSAKFNFRFEFNADSIRTIVNAQDKVVTTLDPKSLCSTAKQSHIIIKISDTAKMPGGNKVIRQDVLTRDLVLRGVKLFVNKSSDSAGLETMTTSGMFYNADTTLLKSGFIQQLKRIDPSIKAIWNTTSFTDSSGNRKMIRYYTRVGGKSIEAGVEGYRFFILQKLLPQIAFAIMLVLLTAAAFIISFRSLKKQLALNAQRNDFIRNMSHELKTPVATVKVALEALKRFNQRNDPEVMEDYLSMAASETDRLELLISKVINISGDNGDLIKPDYSIVNIGELIDEVLRSLKPQIDEEKAIINLKLPIEDVLLKFDKLHLQGILINLIDNSLKYSQKPAEIDIELIQNTNNVVLTVADKGEAIPVEFRSRIFEKFFRVPTGDIHNVKGYGLGLSYAKMVMEQHKGKITYQERPGGGSIFELIIPYIEKQEH